MEHDAMFEIQSDTRTPERRDADEFLAAAAKLPVPSLPADATALPVEAHLVKRHRRPLAVAGLVENGVARPLDPSVKLPEHARVIIVTSEEA